MKKFSRSRLLWNGLPPISALRCMWALYKVRSGNSVPDFKIKYRKFGMKRSAVVRKAHLESDLQSVLELAAGDCYGLSKMNFRPDFVVDGGGNSGLFSLAATARWPDAKVLCFEPMPANVDLIRKHLDINDLCGRVEVFPDALGGENKTAKFYLREANQGSLGEDIAFLASIDVRIKRLWDFYQPFCSGRFLIKLDVEGAEFEILRDFFRHGPLKNITFVLEVHGNASAQKHLLAEAKTAGLTGFFWEQASETAHLFLTSEMSVITH